MSLFTPPNVRATDANNATLSGAQWFFYATGTTTLQPIYTSSARTTEHPNPVPADAGGKFPSIYLDPTLTYRAVLKTAAGATVSGYDIDPIAAPSAAETRFIQSGAGAVARTAEDKARETFSIDDFGADPTGATDSLAALLLALDAVPEGGTLEFPGTYRFSASPLTTAVTINKPMTLGGPGSRINNVPDGNLARGFLYFDTNVGNAIVIDDVAVSIGGGLTITGVGASSTGTGVQVNGANAGLRMHPGCVIQSFNTGLEIDEADYVSVSLSSIVDCKNGIIADSAYNLNLYGININATNGSDRQAITLSNQSQCNIFGGSIEGYDGYGVIVASGSQVSLYGTYMEGDVSDPTAINIQVRDDSSVLAEHLQVYMTGCARHISVESASTVRFRIVSRYTTFLPESTTRRVDYYSFDPTESGGIVNIIGDCYENGVTVGANNNFLNPDFTALGAFAQGTGVYRIEYPMGHAKFGKAIDNRLVGIDGISSPSGGATVDAEARTAISALLTILKANNTTP
jgi:hypothetical protein